MKQTMDGILVPGAYPRKSIPVPKYKYQYSHAAPIYGGKQSGYGIGWIVNILLLIAVIGMVAYWYQSFDWERKEYRNVNWQVWK